MANYAFVFFYAPGALEPISGDSEDIGPGLSYVCKGCLILGRFHMLSNLSLKMGMIVMMTLMMVLGYLRVIQISLSHIIS